VFKATSNGTDAFPNVVYDKQAPFPIGTTALGVVLPPGTIGKNVAQYVRVGASIAAAATAGITAGVSVAAASGNTWTNETGVALVVGDYAWLTSTLVTTP
jgi:hypothetical protein